jgi:hypothetical protein
MGDEVRSRSSSPDNHFHRFPSHSPSHDLSLFPRSQSAAPVDSRNAMLTLPVCRDGGIVRPNPRHSLRPRT